MTGPDLGGSGVGNDASSPCSQLTLLEVCSAALSALPPLHPTWCTGKAGELCVPKPSLVALLPFPAFLHPCSFALSWFLSSWRSWEPQQCVACDISHRSIAVILARLSIGLQGDDALLEAYLV